MKNRHIRAVALTLALVMLLSGAFSGKALAADPAASRVNTLMAATSALITRNGMDITAFPLFNTRSRRMKTA